MSSGMMTSFRSRSGDEPAYPTMDALWEACSARFSPPSYRLRREDSSGTVWVSLEGDRFALGLRPGQLERHSVDDVLSDADARLTANRKCQ